MKQWTEKNPSKQQHYCTVIIESFISYHSSEESFKVGFMIISLQCVYQISKATAQWTKKSILVLATQNTRISIQIITRALIPDWWCLFCITMARFQFFNWNLATAFVLGVRLSVWYHPKDHQQNEQHKSFQNSKGYNRIN